MFGDAPVLSVPAGSGSGVPTSRLITAGTGLTGGGDLSADRTLAVAYGSTSGTAAQGNDSRITGAVQGSRLVSAGTGLTGGGDLSADRSLAVVYGATSGTAAQGNDSRITGAVPSSRLVSAGTGLTGGGDLSADRSLAVTYGSSAGTATQGNDSRVVNALNRTGDTMTGNLVVTNLSASGYAFGIAGPGSHSLLAWAYDPALATAGSLVINGTVYLVKVHVAVDATVTKLHWHLSTAGVTPTAGQNAVGLYNSAGSRLQVTNVDADVSSTGVKTTTITGQAVTAGSFYWVALLFNAATAPTLGRATAVNGAASLINVGLSASGYRFATNGTSQTSLPSSITPGSNAQAGFPLWVAIAA